MNDSIRIVPWDPRLPLPPSIPGIPALTSNELKQSRPDALWLAIHADGTVAGRCAAWWQRTPTLAGKRCGFLGHWAAPDNAIACTLLSSACAALRSAGCASAAGPIDGSTWRPYRFVTDPGTAPPFFMEPQHPPGYPQQFTTFGFHTLASYYSVSDAHLDEPDEQHDRACHRLKPLGLTLRPLNAPQAEEDLREIHRIVTIAFRHAFLYQTLPLAEFIAQYHALRPHVAPEWVTIASHHGRPAGFVFALPDLLQAQRGQHIDQSIIKTLAVLPDRRYAGLGSVLMAASRATAHAAGYQRAIPAFMHEANSSLLIRSGFTEPVRSYAVFGYDL
ncbi:MAG: N-acetyltransferase [Verrucomicrobiota bacterium]|jgi:GNAT superfamily N-acetyltransferase